MWVTILPNSFREHGAIVVSIAEYEGAIYKEDGINEEELFQHRKATGSILNFPGATNLAKKYGCIRIGM